jgi:tetratricopeptide (TPR) repeat protein
VLVRAVERDVRDAGMLNSLAWFAATNDLFLPQALIAAQRAVELEPNNSNILDTLAEVHFRLGQVEQAIACETRALELAPEDNYLKEQITRFRAAAR